MYFQVVVLIYNEFQEVTFLIFFTLNCVYLVIKYSIMPLYYGYAWSIINQHYSSVNINTINF